MTLPDPGQLSVNQADYIQALEDEILREGKARRVLTALLAQRTRTLQTYVERFGDITTAQSPSGQPPSASTAPEASDG